MYKQTVVLNSVVNRSLKIFPVKNFEFARQYNSCILLSQEFMEVSKYYPIGFSKTNDMLIPVAILGVNKNLFIDKNGL